MSKELSQEEIIAMMPGPVMNPNQHFYYGADSRTLLFVGAVDEESASALNSQLLELDSKEPGAPITIHLNTPGGSLIDGLAIYDTIKIISSPVIVVVFGGCMSAGLIILSAADYRVSTPNSVFFYHEPLMYGVNFDSSESAESAHQHYKWCKTKANQLIRDRMDITDKQWEKDFEGSRANYMDPEEVLKLSLIDEILEFSTKSFRIIKDDNKKLKKCKKKKKGKKAKREKA